MFQFAFYLSLRNKFENEKVKIDISWFDNDEFHNGFELKKIFDIDCCFSDDKENSALSRAGYSFLSRIKRRLLPKKKSEIVESKEQQFHFHKNLFGNANEDKYYRGYWQSYKYFDSISALIKSSFRFPPFYEKNNLKMNLYIRNNKDRTVSIHVRLGDYSQHSSLGGICNLEYYNRAILMIEKKIKNPIYIIFSDDIEWCRINFNLSNAKFVDWNKKQSSFRDMQLMSLCDHNIIANSSFSWWGAYLNPNKNKIVIAPKVWIRGNVAKDIILEDWYKI